MCTAEVILMPTESDILFRRDKSLHCIKNDVQYIGENFKNRWYEFWQKFLILNMNSKTKFISLILILSKLNIINQTNLQFLNKIKRLYPLYF